MSIAPLGATRSVMLCPLDDCRWEFDDAALMLPKGVYVDPYEYLLHLMQAREAEVRRHIEGHTALEFLTSIARRDRQLNAARALMTPDDWAKVEQA